MKWDPRPILILRDEPNRGEWLYWGIIGNADGYNKWTTKLVHLVRMLKMRNRRKYTIAIAVVVAMAIGGGAYAFTASNTVPLTTAGAGSGAVSGYTVTNLHYGLNATMPANIDSLTFTIAPGVPSAGAGKVVISAALSTGGPTNYPCTTDTTGTTVTCATTTPQLTAALLTGVTVVAAQ